MVCPHTDQPAHSLLWRGSSREAVQRPQPKAGISEKMGGRGAGNLLIPLCHMQPFSKLRVEPTPWKCPSPCQALKLNFPMG